MKARSHHRLSTTALFPFLLSLSLLLSSCGGTVSQQQGTAESIGGGGNYVTKVEEITKEADLALFLAESGAYDAEICKDRPFAKNFLLKYASEARKAIRSLKIIVTPESLTFEDKKQVKHAVRAKLMLDDVVYLQQSEVDRGNGSALFIHEAFHKAGDFDDFMAIEGYPQEDGRQRQMDESSACALETLAKNYPYAGQTKPAFEKSGTFYIEEETARAMTVDNEGNFIVITVSELPTPDPAYPRLQHRIRKFGPDGKVLLSFGTMGFVNIPRPPNDYKGGVFAFDVRTGDDGAIVVSGFLNYHTSGSMIPQATWYLKHWLFKTSREGKVDTTFNQNVMNDAYNASYYPAWSFFYSAIFDGKKVVATGGYTDGSASHFFTVRYNADGSRDLTFGSDLQGNHQSYGFALTTIRGYDYAYSVVVAPGGGYYVGGQAAANTTAEYAIAVIKLNAYGDLDKSFDGDGKKTVVFPGCQQNWVKQMAVDADGKLVGIGSSGNNNKLSQVVVRFDRSGAPDATFGNGGKVLVPQDDTPSEGRSLILQKDGKIFGAGVSTEATGTFASMFRLLPNGDIDRSFRRGDQSGEIRFLVGPSTMGGGAAKTPGGEIAVFGDVDHNGKRGSYVTLLYGDTGF